jgi:hypothetical protein
MKNSNANKNMLSIRKYKIFGLAITLSMIGMILIFILARWKYFPNLKVYPFVVAGIILAIPLGIVIHIIFGVNTQLNYNFLLSQAPNK